MSLPTGRHPRSSRRPRALAAAAVAVIAGAPLAAAAPASAAGGGHAASHAGSYAASTAADGAAVVLDAPQPVGPLPRHLVVGLVSARGELGHDGIRHASPDRTQASAGLASGSLTTGSGPLAPLARTVTADRAHPATASTLGTLPANPLLAGSLAPLRARVRWLAASASQAELGAGRVARLGDLLPAAVRDQVDAALAQAVPAARSAIAQAIGALGPVLGPIAKQDPTGQAAQLQAALQHLADELPGLVGGVERTAVVTVDGLRAAQRIARHGHVVTSTASARLAGLDVLGGLVRLTGFTSSAVAAASGTAGGASASAASTVASVRVGGEAAGLALTDSGRLVADASGLLPADVVRQVDGALAQVAGAMNRILDTAGVSVTPAAVSHHAAADGTAADASGSGLLVTVQPPGQPHPLLRVAIGAVQARAAGRLVTVMDERTQLPHTGGGLGTGPLLGASAAATVGLWLRRRRPHAG